MPDARPLRVCISTWPYPPVFGGHGIQLRRSLPFLAAEGVDVSVLTKRWEGPASALPAPLPGETVERFLAPGDDRLSKLRRCLEIRRWFVANAHRFDLVHCANLQWELLVSLPFIRDLGLPIVVESVLMDSDDPWTIETQRRFGSLQLRLLSRVDAWLGISEIFRPRFEASSFPADKFRLVYVGVDTDRHRPRSAAEKAALRRELGLPADARIALSVGAVIERKGIDRLLRAWAATRPAPERDRLVVVGPASLAEGLPPADEPFCRDVLAYAGSPALADTVTFVGHSDRVPDYMAAADLWFFLSRREGFGTVTTEAMASGLPCVVSPLDGIADEVLTDGEEGFVCRTPDDAESVARVVSRLLEDEALRRRMGEAGRRRVIERFSMRARARALASLYREIVDREPARRAA